MVCDTKFSADGFSCESLYAAKLTYALAAAQWQRVQPNTLKLSARGRALLEKGCVADKKRQDDHGDRGYPRHDVVPEGVHVLAHQVAPVYKQQNENDHDGEPDPVAHLRENKNLP